MYLNCHSYFSFHYGTLKPEALIGLAMELGVKRMALTDINNTSGCIDFVRQAQKAGIHPVVGVDFRKGIRCRFIALAKNILGFEEINRFLSELNAGQRKVPSRAPQHWQHVWVIYPLEVPHFQLLSHELIGVTPQQVKQLHLSPWRHAAAAQQLVALAPVSFKNKTHFNAHRLLRAMDLNTLLSKLPPTEQGLPEEQFYSPETLHYSYQEVPQLLLRAEELLETCHIDFGFGQNKNKRYFSGSEQTDLELIRAKTLEGLQYRYDTVTPAIEQRVEMELDIIRQKGFLSYFLISWDLLCFARQKGFFYVGRGSGSNSIIAYCLRITDVDPIDLDLYFERFINLYRENPPDFDIDFSWKDRDTVLQYLFGKYGTDHTALLATYNTFQLNSVMRELGKVFGLPAREIDELIQLEKNQPAQHELGRLVQQYGQFLKEYPQHLSIHAGGVLISEEPIYRYTATNMPPKGLPTTQFDMVIAEDAGLYKYDILSQRGLGHIKDTVEIVKANRGKDIDIHRIQEFKEDPEIKALLRTGRTMGCFYVESPAMRMLLTKLEADNYLTLVAASSIIRPGVSHSGMMREYILRYRDPERRKKVHPVMQEIMPDTFGVMVYQEDVIKVAHHFAGLSLAEADVLRRGMSGKYRSREEFQKVKDQFFRNCEAKGYAPQLSQEIWYQIESFAGYSFSKGHSASYAVESYQSLYLKAHFPLEFMVGVINNFGGFYRTELYVHEVRMWGAHVEAPCVNSSEQLTRIQGTTVWLGFVHITNLEESFINLLLAERAQNGPYLNLQDFVKRLHPGLEQLVTLIRCNAFRFSGKNKKELLWEAHFLKQRQPVKKQLSPTLFQPEQAPAQWELPSLESLPGEDALDEIALLGFPLSAPFSLLKDPVDCSLGAADLQQYFGKAVTLILYLVTIKNTWTVKGDRMQFGCFLDSKGFFVDTVHFPQVSQQYPFKGPGCYRVRGTVTEEFGFYSVEVSAMERLPFINRDEA